VLEPEVQEQARAQLWEQEQERVEAVVRVLGQALEQDQDHRPWSPLLASNAQHASTRQRRCGHFDHRN
jgi:hypothetical protein